MTTYESIASEHPNLRTLASFPKIPRKGYVTVCEANGELQAILSVEPENSANAAVFTTLIDHYVPISGENLKPMQARKIPSIKTTISNETFLISQSERGLKAVWDGW
jgi:hypothetical protein